MANAERGAAFLDAERVRRGCIDGVPIVALVRAVEGQACLLRDARPAVADEHQPGAENAVGAKLSGPDADVARLAALPVLEYERVRIAEAALHGYRVGVLDAEVSKARASSKSPQEEQGCALDLPDVEPWLHPIDGAELLDEIASTFRRFAVTPEGADTVASLWVLMTYLIESISVAPLLAFTSPEKGCGKTTLLEILARLAHRPLPVSNVTSAALFRAVEKWGPTLLVDEADTFLAENDELRGVLNSGHTRGTAFVVRCVGDESEPRIFSTWGAKAIAAIGTLPDTIMDRAIEIRLRRALPEERVEKIRRADPVHFKRIARMSARWALDNAQAVSSAVPDVPAALSNRAGDNAEPLLAIADQTGTKWSKRARRALLALAGKTIEGPSLGVQLLRDMLTVFADRKTDRLPTREIIDALAADELAPWPTLDHGRPITPRQLARRLSDFGVRPTTYRDGTTTHKGYERGDVEEQARRYATPQSGPSVTGNKGNSSNGTTETPHKPGFDSAVTEVPGNKNAALGSNNEPVEVEI